MKATIIEAFNHVEVIGPHVIEGHFDLSESSSFLLITLLHNHENKQSHLFLHGSLAV